MAFEPDRFAGRDRALELLQIGPDGKVRRGEVFYGVVPTGQATPGR